MKRILAILIVVAVFPTLALAHGKEGHVLGTVKAVSGNSITVELKDGGTKTVAIDSKTKFVKSGEAASVNDLKVGERVAISVDEHGGSAVATSVKFGAQKKGAVGHKH